MIENHSYAQLEALNLPLHELRAAVEMIALRERNPILDASASRMAHIEAAIALLDDSLFYARMYKDTSEEGKVLRENLIDDSEMIISLIRNGGLTHEMRLRSIRTAHRHRVSRLHAHRGATDAGC